MNYKELAANILSMVGGKENVLNVTHCATRLRFNLKDESKAQTDALKRVNGVMGVVNKGGQYQVIIGSDVGSVYKELPVLENAGESSERKSETDKKGPVTRVLDTIAGIFTPIISAITGAGMLKAVLALLVAFNLVSPESSTYQFMNFFGDAAFYFLPILIANSAAVKFKCSPYMAMSLGGILLYPDFISMVNAAKEAGTSLTFIGLPVSLVTYSSSVIPIILGVWFMSFIEPLADKVSPKPVKFFTKPLLTLLITAPVTLIILGPLGSIIGNGIAAGINWLSTYASWLVPLIIGTFFPLLVMTGMHYGIIPIGLNNLATMKFDTIVGPGSMTSNIAQGAAALAVSIRTKNSSIRQLATSAGITAVCGITEPAMYGISLRFKRPLIAAMIGGGVGGLFLGLTHVGRYTAGSPGLLSLPGYIGTEGFQNIIFACIGCAISFVVSFIVSFFLGIEDPVEEDSIKDEKDESVSAVDSQAEKTELKTGEIKTEKGDTVIYSPIEGKAIPLSKVNDPTFAEEILGKGVAVIPKEGKVYAPFDGTVETVFDTKHAIGLTCSNGVEILIHVGLDTVSLGGKYFTAHVASGDTVKKGQLLLDFEMDKIAEEGFETVTPVIVSNTADYEDIIALAGRDVAVGDQILSILSKREGE